MMPPNSPANDTDRPAAPRPICVPRPSRPQALIPGPRQSAPPKPRLVTSNPTPPPAPRRSVEKPSIAAPPPARAKAAPPPLPSKWAPPPLPQPALLSDADLVDDEDTAQATRAPQPSAEDVDLDCFTRSEPPPESRPQRKRAWFAGITGLVLVTMTGLALAVGPTTSRAVRSLSPVTSEPARVPAMLTVAALATPVAANAAQTAPHSVTIGAVSRAKLSARGKGDPRTTLNAKKPAATKLTATKLAGR